MTCKPAGSARGPHPAWGQEEGNMLLLQPCTSHDEDERLEPRVGERHPLTEVLFVVEVGGVMGHDPKITLSRGDPLRRVAQSTQQLVRTDSML